LISKVRDASPWEVFGEWLKYEYRHRWHNEIDLAFPGSSVLILSPNYSDSASNQKRLLILQRFRRNVLDGIAADTAWTVSAADRESVQELLLINSGGWRDITSGTCRVADAAKAINNDPGLREGPYATSVNYILDNCEELAMTAARITAVGPEQGPIVVLDGVHRIIALHLFYFVRRGGDFGPREIYLGRSSSDYVRIFD
jgi:hypothetical protein